jgi:hypothetical protein
MTPALRLLFNFLWIIPHVLQLAILAALVRRGLFRRFPVFAAYIAFAVCNFVALFIIDWSKLGTAVYFQWYSYGIGIDTALRFGIVCELFAHVFRNHSVLRNVQKPLFRCTTVAFLIIAFSFAVYTHRLDTDPAWFNVHMLERSANIVLCGLLLAIFLVSYWLELSWNRIVFGMALGLGILCSLELATAATRSQVGRSAHVALDLLGMGTYCCCVLIWLFYLVVPERSSGHIIDKIPDGDLEAWNQELEQLLQQ